MHLNLTFVNILLVTSMFQGTLFLLLVILSNLQNITICFPYFDSIFYPFSKLSLPDRQMTRYLAVMQIMTRNNRYLYKCNIHIYVHYCLKNIGYNTSSLEVLASINISIPFFITYKPPKYTVCISNAFCFVL